MILKSILLLNLYFLLVTSEVTTLNVIERLFDRCSTKDELFKCFKIQAIKAVNKAVSVNNLSLFDGVSLVTNQRQRRMLRPGLILNDTKLEKLESQELNDMLKDTTNRFLDSHQMEVKVSELIEEGRKKKNKGGGGNAALYWALAIKGTFLAVAYKGIAVMSGLALIMGKMALLLSAILGLKKLVSGGHEQTTFEIVKQPKYSESHTHSTSYEDEGYSHHRIYDPADSASRRVIKAYF